MHNSLFRLFMTHYCKCNVVVVVAVIIIIHKHFAICTYGIQKRISDLFFSSCANACGEKRLFVFVVCTTIRENRLVCQTATAAACCWCRVKKNIRRNRVMTKTFSVGSIYGFTWEKYVVFGICEWAKTSKPSHAFIRMHLTCTFSLSHEHSRASMSDACSARSLLFLFLCAQHWWWLWCCLGDYFHFFFSYIVSVICNLFGHIHILLHFCGDHAVIFVVCRQLARPRERAREENVITHGLMVRTVEVLGRRHDET